MSGEEWRKNENEEMRNEKREMGNEKMKKMRNDK